MNAVSFKLVGDWRKQIDVTLNQAMSVAQDVFHKDAGDICKYAVIRMAIFLRQKSGPTPTAKDRREIKRDEKGEYVERWMQGWSNPQKIYKFFFNKGFDRSGNSQVKNFQGAAMDDAGWERAQVIGKKAGLARRSWMWGLGQWGGKEERTPVAGASEVYFNETAEKVEAVKRNKLAYILDIMPGGWLDQAVEDAKKFIMNKAARTMEKKFISTIRSGNLEGARSVKSYFLPEAA